MNRVLKNYWATLSSQEKTKYKKYATYSLVIAVALFAYYGTGQDKKNDSDIKAKNEILEIAEEKNLFEDDIRADLNGKVNAVNTNVEEQDKKIAALQTMMSELSKNNQVEAPIDNSEKISIDLNRHKSYPDVPNYPPMPAPLYSRGESDDVDVQIETQIIGGIGHVEGDKIENNDNSKKKNIVPLPPSFMPAKLLTGIDAMTTELGQGNPETIVFRVQAPAVLPNSLKANLKGCFVVGNGTGSLAKERVQVKLVSLHCMSLSGEAVIDERIKGFVADADGKRDMSGIVVTKAGSNLARSFMAGVFGGIGDAVSASSTTTTTSAIGSTSVIDPEKAAQAGLGSGLKAGSSELQKYFLDLAKQATPVIEVGASKDVTIVIQESVNLEIKEFNNEAA